MNDLVTLFELFAYIAVLPVLAYRVIRFDEKRRDEWTPGQLLGMQALMFGLWTIPAHFFATRRRERGWFLATLGALLLGVIVVGLYLFWGWVGESLIDGL